MSMRLMSSAFAQGSRIPAYHTCDGADLSPPLAWVGAPPATGSFALVCADPDAPSGTWYHWGIFDIANDVSRLASYGRASCAGMRQAINDFGKPGYGGPCPPRGHGRHRYHFTLYALGVTHLDMPVAPTCREVEDAARSQALASATLSGYYER
jgi:Raf kinase inhibitor-like YbhB/YbcL family protein